MNAGRRVVVGGILGAVLIAGALVLLGGEEEIAVPQGQVTQMGAMAKPSPSATAVHNRRTVSGKLKQIGANAYSRARRAVHRLL